MNPCGQACAGNDTGVSGKGSSVSVTWQRNKTFILNYSIKAAIVVWFLKKDWNFLQFCQAKKERKEYKVLNFSYIYSKGNKTNKSQLDLFASFL